MLDELNNIINKIDKESDKYVHCRNIVNLFEERHQLLSLNRKTTVNTNDLLSNFYKISQEKDELFTDFYQKSLDYFIDLKNKNKD